MSGSRGTDSIVEGQSLVSGSKGPDSIEGQSLMSGSREPDHIVEGKTW